MSLGGIASPVYRCGRYSFQMLEMAQAGESAQALAGRNPPIARVILHGGKDPVLHFNYRTDLNSFWENASLQGRYKYSTIYPDGDEAGIRITL